MSSSKSANKTTLLILAGGLGLGGSEQQLFLLMRHISQDDFACHILVFNPEQDYFTKPLQQAGITIWPMPKAYKKIWQRSYHVYQVIRQIRPQIVHSWTFHDNAYAGIIGRLSGVPICWGSQRNAYVVPAVQKLPTFLRYLCFYTVSKIVFNSKTAADEFVQLGYPRERMVILQNCLDIVEKPPITLELPPSIREKLRGYRIIGTVGNLRRQKNHLMFVEGIARLLSHHKDIRAVIVGQEVADEPEVWHEIEQRIKELNVTDRIYLIGFHPNARQLMQYFSIFCLTSDYEGMPNVVMEAMEACCPIVATRVGDVPQLINDGVHGKLVEVGDVDAFAQALSDLLQNPKLMQEMAKASQKRMCEAFDCRRTARELATLYKQTCQKR